jgi:hypothetical protein
MSYSRSGFLNFAGRSGGRSGKGEVAPCPPPRATNGPEASLRPSGSLVGNSGMTYLELELAPCTIEGRVRRVDPPAVAARPASLAAVQPWAGRAFGVLNENPCVIK